MPQFPSGQPSADDTHPFLTPNGLRLQQQAPMIEGNAPQPLPEFPPVEQEVVIESEVVAAKCEPVPKEDAPPPFDPFDFGAKPVGKLQNILASKRFPRPEVLGRTQLDPYFNSYPVPKTERKLFRSIGKLFIQITDDPGQELATGSAWVSGPSTIVTSAHNLYDFGTRKWSLAMEFHPGFDYFTKKKLPTCRVTGCTIPNGYLNNPTANHDIAICHVDVNIGDIIDAQIPLRTVESNEFFDDTPVEIVGYPSGSGFDFGKQLWRSEGDYLFGRSNGPDDDYSPVMATNFGSGSSGCPWLVKDEATGEYSAVGVTSGHARLRYVRGEPNLMSLMSPYFGEKMFNNLGEDSVFHEFSNNG